MNFNNVNNEEDLAFIKSIVCKLENYRCNVSLVFIYNALEDKIMLEKMDSSDVKKLINFTHDCYYEMSVCDLDILCEAVSEYADDILNNDCDKRQIINLCIDKQCD